MHGDYSQLKFSIEKNWWRGGGGGGGTTLSPSSSAVSSPRHPPPPTGRTWLQRNPVTSRPSSCRGYVGDEKMGVASRAPRDRYIFAGWLTQSGQFRVERGRSSSTHPNRARSQRWLTVRGSQRNFCCCCLFFFFVFLLDICLARAQHGYDWGWMWSYLLQNEGNCHRSHRWATKTLQLSQFVDSSCSCIDKWT